MPAGGKLELRDMSHAIAKRASRHGKIEIKFSIARVIRIERHPEQALFARRAREHSVDVEKRRFAELKSSQVQHENLPGLLDNKKMIHIARRGGDKKRLSQA